MNPWDIDVDNFVSNYNADWRGGKKIETYNPNSLLDSSPTIFSRSGYLNTSFFVNFTDPRRVIFAEKFFRYKRNIEEFLKYIRISQVFIAPGKNYYNIFQGFYYNLLGFFIYLQRKKFLTNISLLSKPHKKSLVKACSNALALAKGQLKIALKTIGVLRLTHSVVFSGGLKGVYKKNSNFYYQPARLIVNNLVFRFYLYSSWVAKKFYKVTHWFNLNAQSLKHKNYKNDFRLMAGHRSAELGEFAKWSLFFLSDKDKTSLKSAYDYLQQIKIQKKKSALNRKMRRKIFFMNRSFIKAKIKLINSLKRLNKALAKKEKKKKFLRLYKHIQDMSYISKKKKSLQRKITGTRLLRERCARIQEHLSEVIIKKGTLDRNFVRKITSLAGKAYELRLRCTEDHNESLHLLYNVFSDPDDIILAYKVRRYLAKQALARRQKKIKNYMRFLKSAIGPHRRWNNADNRKSLMFFNKWARFQNKRIHFHKRRVTRNLWAIANAMRFMFSNKNACAKRVKIYNKVLFFLKKKGLGTSEKKGLLRSTRKITYSRSLDVKSFRLKIKKSKKIFKRLGRRNKRSYRRIGVSTKWNVKNSKKFLSYFNYFICNIALYSQLLKKAKMQKTKNLKLLRDLSTGLYAWRKKAKYVESRFKKFLTHKRALDIEEKKANLLTLYGKNLKKKGFMMGVTNPAAQEYSHKIKFLLNELELAKKDSALDYLKAKNAFNLNKKKVKKAMLALFFKKEKFSNAQNYDKHLQNQKPKFYKSLAKSKRFKFINLIVKIKLKLIKIRKVFMLFILQNLKNKFWVSFSLLSKEKTYTYDMLVFLKKYMLLKKYITKSDKNIYFSVNSPLKKVCAK